MRCCFWLIKIQFLGGFRTVGKTFISNPHFVLYYLYSLSIFLFSPPLSFLLGVSDSQRVCLTLGQIHVCFSVVAGKTAA